MDTASLRKRTYQSTWWFVIHSKDIPVLNNIYHFVVTFHVLQAENKNHLSTQSRLSFSRHRKVNYPKTDMSSIKMMTTDLPKGKFAPLYRTFKGLGDGLPYFLKQRQILSWIHVEEPIAQYTYCLSVFNTQRTFMCLCIYSFSSPTSNSKPCWSEIFCTVDRKIYLFSEGCRVPTTAIFLAFNNEAFPQRYSVRGGYGILFSFIGYSTSTKVIILIFLASAINIMSCLALNELRITMWKNIRIS